MDNLIMHNWPHMLDRYTNIFWALYKRWVEVFATDQPVFVADAYFALYIINEFSMNNVTLEPHACVK